MNKMCDDKVIPCSGRREFLVSASAIAGGLVLSLANVQETSATVPPTETVIKLDENSPLNKVGGYTIVDSPSGKIIIARTGDSSFSAVSAICTHKGSTIRYDDKANLFACPSHGSKYNPDGTNAGGPAKSPLKASKIQNALLLISE